MVGATANNLSGIRFKISALISIKDVFVLFGVTIFYPTFCAKSVLQIFCIKLLTYNPWVGWGQFGQMEVGYNMGVWSWSQYVLVLTLNSNIFLALPSKHKFRIRPQWSQCVVPKNHRFRASFECYNSHIHLATGIMLCLLFQAVKYA